MKNATPLCLILVFAIQIFLFPVHVQSEEDLYQILGVSKSATIQDIKRAYRRKAKDTHPDKRTDVTTEQAAEAFHKLVHAFEVLSDENSRMQYDRTGSSGHKRPRIIIRQPNQRQNSAHIWRQSGRNEKRYQRDVLLAMSRVMHIVSLAQLQSVMLDENGLLERNLLICFVTPGRTEEVAFDNMIFPYSFAHMSEDGIWWEDKLQTAMIRIEFDGYLSEFFNLPEYEMWRASGHPIFLYGKRGMPLKHESFARLQTTHYNRFYSWVWKQMEVTVKFVNQHDHAVEGFWMSQGKAQKIFTLGPGKESSFNSNLGHRWWVRDERVDNFKNAPSGDPVITEESSLSYCEVSDETNPQTCHVKKKTCFDLSGHCQRWKGQGDCVNNLGFMKQYCRLSCRFCSERDDAVKMLEVKKKRNSRRDEL